MFLAAVASLCGVAPSAAVPPPPPHPVVKVDLHPDGSERLVNNEVRAYRQVPLAFEASAGDELMLWLTDSGACSSLTSKPLRASVGYRGQRPALTGFVCAFRKPGHIACMWPCPAMQRAPAGKPLSGSG